MKMCVGWTGLHRAQDSLPGCSLGMWVLPRGGRTNKTSSKLDSHPPTGRNTCDYAISTGVSLGYMGIKMSRFSGRDCSLARGMSASKQKLVESNLVGQVDLHKRHQLLVVEDQGCVGSSFSILAHPSSISGQATGALYCNLYL
jgi:hypothetical protein